MNFIYFPELLRYQWPHLHPIRCSNSRPLWPHFHIPPSLPFSPSFPLSLPPFLPLPLPLSPSFPLAPSYLGSGVIGAGGEKSARRIPGDRVDLVRVALPGKPTRMEGPRKKEAGKRSVSHGTRPVLNLSPVPCPVHPKILPGTFARAPAPLASNPRA